MPRRVNLQRRRRDGGGRSRGWCFTINNYAEAHKDAIAKLGDECEYVCFGEEIAPGTGTPHLQGYIYFKHQRAFVSVRDLFDGAAHIEPAKGSPSQNRAYCSKDGKFVEYGVLPRQGKQSNYEAMRDQFQQGVSARHLIATAKSVIAVKGVETLVKYDEKDLNESKPIEIIWCYGPTGTGKSHWCRKWIKDHEYSGKMWKMGVDLKWFDGYMGHELAFLDDLRPDAVSWAFLLKIIQGTKEWVPVKNGGAWFWPDVILITCPWHPREFAPAREDPLQLVRRCTRIIEFKKKAENSVIPIRMPVEEIIEQ